MLFRPPGERHAARRAEHEHRRLPWRPRVDGLADFMLVAIRVQRRARIRIAAVQQVSVWLEACKSDLDDQRGP